MDNYVAEFVICEDDFDENGRYNGGEFIFKKDNKMIGSFSINFYDLSMESIVKFDEILMLNVGNHKITQDWGNGGYTMSIDDNIITFTVIHFGAILISSYISNLSFLSSFRLMISKFIIGREQKDENI